MPALALVVALHVLGQAGSAAGGANGAGARPAECAPLSGPSASNVWERAKYPALRRYCDLLASGAAKLASGGGAEEAHEAVANADEAAAVFPGHAAPTVLRGRAFVALGQWREAARAIEEANAQDPHALDDPAALFAWARALGRVGRLADAEAALRTLLPRASALPPSERGKAEIEAALLAEARGRAGLDEAIALLRQACRDAQDSLQAIAGIGLSLALDRAGEREESRATLGSTKRDPRSLVEDARVVEVLGDVGALAEADALAAFSLGDRDAAGARQQWAKYLAGPGGKGPWADHARASQEGPRAKGERGR
jgi:tetratricopeptide (TPR) repeat protein